MANHRTDLMQGTLELLILKTLSHDSMHGYGIAQRIHQSVADLLKIEDGSLYPALYRMENAAGSRLSGGRKTIVEPNSTN